MSNTAENQNNDIPEENENQENIHNDEAVSELHEDDALTLITKERDDLRDKLMRALAEAENTRKRMERSQADTTKYAVTGFAKDMLDIADNLHRALHAITEEQMENETVKLLYNGVAATEKIMLSTLEKHGIQKIEPTKGKFDPNFHEVMFETEIPGKDNGEIIQLLEAGYTIHDRLLRPARVGVAKAANKGGTDYSIDEEV